MFTVYILFSLKTKKYFTGQTKNLQNRMFEHNSGETKSLVSGIPWKLIWSTNLNSRAEAVQLELKIKGKGAKRFLNEKSSIS